MSVNTQTIELEMKKQIQKFGRTLLYILKNNVVLHIMLIQILNFDHEITNSFSSAPWARSLFSLFGKRGYSIKLHSRFPLCLVEPEKHGIRHRTS